MPIAKVINSGADQFVCLPKGFWFDTPEVDISRVGESLILAPSRKTMSVPFDATEFTPIPRELLDDVFDGVRDESTADNPGAGVIHHNGIDQ